MKVIPCIACMGVFSIGFADEAQEFLLEDARGILNQPMELLAQNPEFSVKEDPDHVDENETIILTEKWSLSYRDGRSLTVMSDNGVATGVIIRDRRHVVRNGVQVGDTLEKVLGAYPEARFDNGSRDVLTDSLFLYAEKGNVVFVFYDPTVSDSIDSGTTYRTDDPAIRSIELNSITFRDGNNFACGEKMPCPLVPDRFRGD